jgi:hypothetical protein
LHGITPPAPKGSDRHDGKHGGDTQADQDLLSA